MANFKKITFKLKMKELPDSPTLTKALDKIGSYRFKEVKENRREAYITGEAESRKVIDRLAKALGATVDDVLYHFEFNCDEKTLVESYNNIKGTGMFNGVKVEITERNGRIRYVKGTTTSDDKIRGLEQLFGRK